jgi:GDPmannose 4,6-dehydratase
MWMMLQQEKPDDYIIASGETHSVRELVECAFNCVGLNWQNYVSVDPAFYRPDESVQLVGCIGKIKLQLHWTPQHSFEQLVEIMVDHDLKELSYRKA